MTSAIQKWAKRAWAAEEKLGFAVERLAHIEKILPIMERNYKARLELAESKLAHALAKLRELGVEEQTKFPCSCSCSIGTCSRATMSDTQYCVLSLNRIKKGQV